MARAQLSQHAYEEAADRDAAEQADAERTAAEHAAVERVAAEHAAAERVAAEHAAAERVTAERAAVERAACQGLAGPWYARREREAVKAMVQWFNGSMIETRAQAQTRQKMRGEDSGLQE